LRPERRQIGIAGAGIAGLTAALALNAIGYNVRIFEARPELPLQGAGIQMPPNAFHVLGDLGLGNFLQSVGFAPDRIDLHDGSSAKPLTHFQLGEPFREKYGAPYLVVARSDLATLLQNACADRGGIDIQFNCRVVEAAQHGRGVTAMVERTSDTGFVQMEDTPLFALIGADGVRSQVTGMVERSQCAQFSGHIAWRGLVQIEDFPAALPRDSTGLWQMPGAHVVHYPVYQGRMANVVVVTPWHQAGATSSSPNDAAIIRDAGWLSRDQNKVPQQVRDALSKKGLAAPLAALLECEGSWGGWPLFAHRKLGALFDGSIGLTGDAAHAMVPYAAQGGAAAIEDAAVLAKCFEKNPDDAAKAFANYSKVRKPRVRQVMNLSQSNRKIYHLGGPMRVARNLVMRNTPPHVLEQRMDWLYKWRVDA